MRHFPLRELGYAIGFIVLLAVLYVGAYYAMVEKDYVATPRMSIVVVSYRFGDEWSESFFSPAHAVDQRFRPEFWKYEISPSALRGAVIGAGGK